MDRVGWDDRVGIYSDILSVDWWKLTKNAHPFARHTTEGVMEYSSLERKQKQVYNLFINHCAAWCDELDPEPILVNLEGEGGTGKTAVVRAICAGLDEITNNAGYPMCVARAAPTGVAAHNIGGQTIHSLFQLPIKKRELENLSTAPLTSLQARFRNIRYIIIDEKSMLSVIMLQWVNLRLQQIKVNNDDFGGLSLLLLGDFCQLPPVGGVPLFSTIKHANVDVILGQELYRRIDKTITLNVVKRQDSSDPDSMAFKTALAHLRMNEVTLQDWKLLSKRVRANVSLTGEDLSGFDNATRIFQHREEVGDYNFSRLRQLNNPVLKIKATHRGHQADQATTEIAGNLEQQLYISIDSRVMLLENTWADHGLFNGSVGVVCDIVWSEGSDPNQTPPFALLIFFEGYNGPELFLDPHTGRKLVPIFRATREWIRGTVNCTRTQFPITLAYAITIHKAQGISVSKCVLNLTGQKDFAAGLSYVAISRCRTLGGILFEEPFSYNRFKSKASTTVVMRNADYVRRRAEEVPLSPDQSDDEDYGYDTDLL